MKFKLLIIISIAILTLVGCASTIKPMTIPEYKPPDLSSLKRPVIIATPQEGVDYTIDREKHTITYTITGQDKLTANTISEAVAWRAVEMVKQIVDIQAQIINQNNQLIIYIDLQRQYEAHRADRAEIKAIISEIIGLLGIGLAVAGAL